MNRNMIKNIIIFSVILTCLWAFWKIRKYKFNSWMLDTKLIKKLNNKKILWVYWDDLDGFENRPEYIKLCLETIQRHSTDFTLIMLTKDNIENYLPELIEIKYRINLEKLLLAQKVDLYRIMLMYKYGGFYMDADTILLKSPIKVYDMLDKYDYIGFGCTGTKCFPENEYGYPSNSIVISRKNTKLMKNIFDNIIIRLQQNTDFKDNKNYFEIGKFAIWEELNKLIKNEKYKYYHIISEIGIRDTEGKWVTADRLFSYEKFDFRDEDKLVMILLYNNMMKNLRELTRDTILYSNWKIANYFKKSLDIV